MAKRYGTPRLRASRSSATLWAWRALLEILIDESGRVASARVVQSIPLLDAAARAPVRFLIY
jgi:hypothetical protein